MENFITLEISHSSSVPKYKQIVNSVINKIELGQIKYGQKLPSINRLSFDYYLARDTVEKAYIALKDMGVIESVKGKGYYVINSAPETGIKVLVIFNKLSKYKQIILGEMSRLLGKKVDLDFLIHHCNIELFKKYIEEHLEGYSYYVIMPHFPEQDYPEFIDIMSKVPKNKVILLDRQVDGYTNYFSSIYQDFKLDIYETLGQAEDYLKKYKRLVLVFPENKSYPFPKDIILGFRRYCSFKNIPHEIINRVDENHVPERGSAYVVVEEHDLINLIKVQRQHKLKLKKDIGILSYNDIPLKEVLAEGITVITPDFEDMAYQAASSILNSEPIEIRNEFSFIPRNSL